MKFVYLAFVVALASTVIRAAPATGAGVGETAGIELVETRDGKPEDEIVIPYKKYRLANGLTVILHEDRSDPLVHVDVTYHVGSAREEIGKSGLAHLFEHIMFSGSDHVAPGQHWRLVIESGGVLNGTTNADRTNYYQTVPSNQLERMLWLEADRMGFLLDSITRSAFELQRASVKNERGQRFDNRPYGLLTERVGEALYPGGHPYSWPPIGYMEDLDRVTLADLKRFFLRWYGPNNAVLTIGGDFDEQQALAWIAKYFGPIPPGPDVASEGKPPVTLPADRYLSLEDNVAAPMLHIAFPTAFVFHVDEAPLDVLMFILGVGETSLLYKNMVKEGLATEASAFHGCQELACTFAVTAIANPAKGTTLAELERIVRTSFQEFERRGVTEDDILRVKAKIVSDMVYGIESVSGKVSRLAFYEIITGSPDFASADIARYERVAAADVMRVYRRYIKGKGAVVMSIVPRGRAQLRAREDTWQGPARNLPDKQPKAAAIKARRVRDSFDRGKVPASGPVPEITAPLVWRGQLKNGLKVLGMRNIETPTTTISLFLAAGQSRESLQQLGLASMTAAMVDQSTQHATNEEISNRLQILGSMLNIKSNNHRTMVNVRALTRHLDATLAILREKLLEPKFDPADFARVKTQQLELIEHDQKDAKKTAEAILELALLGRNHPIAHRALGTKATARALSLRDVRDFHRRYYSPTAAGLVVVSNLGMREVMAKLSVLETWRAGAVPPEPPVRLPDDKTTKIYLVHKDAAPQSEIRIGKRTLPFDATDDFYRAKLANFILGDATNGGRISDNIGGRKGYAYSSWSRLDGERHYGAFVVGGAVREDATTASIIEFRKEIQRFARQGPSHEETNFVRAAIGQRNALIFETPIQKIGLIGSVLIHDIPLDFMAEQNRILREITAKQLRSVTRPHLNMDGMAIVVVGDAAKHLPCLKKLGYDIVHLHADGGILPPSAVDGTPPPSAVDGTPPPSAVDGSVLPPPTVSTMRGCSTKRGRHEWRNRREHRAVQTFRPDRPFPN